MRSVIITILSVMVLVLGVSEACAQDIFEQSKGLYSTVDITKSIKLDGQKKIIIRSANSLRGHISIRVNTSDSVSMVFFKRARTESRSKAMDYIDLITVAMKERPDHIVLELRAPNPAPWNSSRETGLVEANLTLPAGFEVEIEAQYFNVTVRGPINELVATSSLGKFDVSEVHGLLDISTNNQSVSLESVTGDISVSTSNEDLVITDLNSGSEAAVLRNDHGDIRLERVFGEINVKTKYGRIDVREFAPSGEGNFIRGFHGPITLQLSPLAKGPLVVNNRYEDISIVFPDTLSAYLFLSVDDEGLIEATNFPFRTELVEKDRLNLISGNGDVEIIGSVNGQGHIYVRGEKGE